MAIIKIISYQTKNKKHPFASWLEELPIKTQAIVLERIARVRLGNFGDCKQIKGHKGIWELRIDYGPGFRIYYAKEGMDIVILLIGGDKGSQNRDILKAKRYWQEYKESNS